MLRSILNLFPYLSIFFFIFYPCPSLRYIYLSFSFTASLFLFSCFTHTLARTLAFLTVEITIITSRIRDKRRR